MTTHGSDPAEPLYAREVTTQQPPSADADVGLEHRVDYDRGVLLEVDAPADPYLLLQRWLSDAEEAGEAEFNSMALATADAMGRPSVRNVLLRGLDEGGRLEFFTNQDSRKGIELAVNDRVALLFSWLGIRRQVRVEGVAARLSDALSDAYFASRPRESRIGAWASAQSSVLVDRAELDALVVEMTDRFADEEVPRPPNWGGYGVTPDVFEFWQGRPSRLHDRLRYRRGSPSDGWVRDRLAP